MFRVLRKELEIDIASIFLTVMVAESHPEFAGRLVPFRRHLRQTPILDSLRAVHLS
jgi:hypothetical protein